MLYPNRSLKLYSVNDDVNILVDANSHAVRVAVLQQNRPAVYAYKSVTNDQSRYSQLDKEAFTVKFGCENIYEYLWGKNITIETNHNILQSIFSKPIYKSITDYKKLD